MIVVQPIAIGDEQLVATNVPDTDAPAWAPGSYDTDAEVTRNRRVYRSAVDDNEDEPPAAGWLDLGPINRWRMFDGSAAAATQLAGGIDVTLAPGGLVNALGLVNVMGSSVTVQVIVDDAVVDERTQALLEPHGAWWPLFFEPQAQRRDVAFLDLSAPPGAHVRVMIVGAVAWCGELVIGRQQSLGDTLFPSSVGIVDHSRIDVDEWGNTRIARRRYRQRAEYVFALDSQRVAHVRNVLAGLRATPSLYVGVRHRDESIVLGLAPRFEVTVPGPLRSRCSLELNSLAYEQGDDVRGGAAVEAPQMLVPTGGETVPYTGVVRTSEFSVAGGGDAHLATDWQFASDAGMTDVLVDVPASVELVELPVPFGAGDVSSHVWVRARHVGTVLGPGLWSAPARMTIGAAASVAAPMISGGDIYAGGTIDASAFVGGDDEHWATDWVIATGPGLGDVVLETWGDREHLTALPVPADLDLDATYYVVCRHHGRRRGPSDWSAAVAVTLRAGGQIEWDVPGEHVWIVPPGVHSICAVAVGPGGGGMLNFTVGGQPAFWYAAGGGGALAWRNDIPVEPGQTVVARVGPGQPTNALNYVPPVHTTIHVDGVLVLRARAASGPHPGELEPSDLADGGGAGGWGGDDPGLHASIGGGGGGAGGYDGRGGDGSRQPGVPGEGGQPASGAAGGAATGRGGGGVGLRGRGATGTAAPPPTPGSGGSGGNGGAPNGPGGRCGGGGGGRDDLPIVAGGHPGGAPGGVRLIWGADRAYPATNTGDV